MTVTSFKSFGIKEIAKKANVSIATVDRVIHNRTGVSETTKSKITSLMKEFKYEPNILARRLASKKKLNFAVLIPKVSDETDFWAGPLNGVQQAATEIKQYGIKIDIYFFDLNDRSTFIKKAASVLKHSYQGILFAPSFIEESMKFSMDCDKRKIPYIFINSDIPDQKNLCYFGPDLFQSGYLGAHLVKYLVKDKDKILLVNISKEIDNQHHLLRKEEGFRAYFDRLAKNEIVKIDIRQTDDLSVRRKLTTVLKKHVIKAVFVTNSRVSTVANYLEEACIKNITVVGYDYLQSNLDCLEKDTIDFLICQKPREQGYRGIMALYNALVHNTITDKIHFMPIDIITKENYKFYSN